MSSFTPSSHTQKNPQCCPRHLCIPTSALPCLRRSQAWLSKDSVKTPYDFSGEMRYHTVLACYSSDAQ